MPKTKKVGLTGKYGTRYGRKIRQQVLKAGTQKKFRCPDCMKLTMKRVVSGIWVCSKCGAKLAGKAYKPK